MQHYSFTSSVTSLTACAPLPPSGLIKSSAATPFNNNYLSSLAHVSSTTDNAMTLISPLFKQKVYQEDGSFW